MWHEELQVYVLHRESNARDVSTSIELHSAMEDQSVIRQSKSPSVDIESALQNDSRRNSSYSSVYGTPAASEASMAKSVSKSGGNCLKHAQRHRLGILRLSSTC